MKTLRDRLLIPAAVMLLLGISSTGVAQPTRAGTRAPDPASLVYAPAPEYGTSTQAIETVSITEFRSDDATDSLKVYNSGNIHFYQSSTGFPDWWARLKLPAGVVVDSVELDACDNTATGQIQFVLFRGTAGGSGGANLSDFGTTGNAATPGCGFTSITPYSPVIIDNQNYNYWLLAAFTGDHTQNLRAAGFRVHYHRQVSPAPGVASFSDVPTSHWAFQYVEALKASGITQGVTPTTYEPESNVTRAQMAVFLAKALGLHFPN